MSFEAPLDSGGLTITGYNVYAYTSAPTTSSNTPATLNSVSVWTGALSPITVSGTTDGTQYWFSARAVNTLRDVNSGEGDISYAGGAQASVTTGNAPGVPTGTYGISGDSQATLTWVAPTDTGGSGISVTYYLSLIHI